MSSPTPPPAPATTTSAPPPTGPTLSLRSIVSDLTKLTQQPSLLSIPPPSPAPSANLLSPLPSSAKHLSGEHAALLARAAEELAVDCELASEGMSRLGERVEGVERWVAETGEQLSAQMDA